MVIANASNTPDRPGRAQSRAGQFKAQVSRPDRRYALIAIQGPEAAGILAPLTDVALDDLKYYAGHDGTVAGRRALVAAPATPVRTASSCSSRPRTPSRCGTRWPARDARRAWCRAGLAARDTLRLEAGMPLYGNELGPDTTPYDAGLGRVVKFDKPGGFVGAAALDGRAQATPGRVLAGLTMASRRVPRHGYTVLASGQAAGTVTSGAPSPTLGVPIALAYLTPEAMSAR